jgi:hypothetical protein
MAMCPTDLSEEKRAVWNVESLTIRGRGFCLITLIRSYLAKLFPMRRIALVPLSLFLLSCSCAADCCEVYLNLSRGLIQLRKLVSG